VDIKAREAYRAKIHLLRLSSSRPGFVRLNGRKLILAKTIICAVCCRVIHCLHVLLASSYYRRWIHTSLSSLQSHVLTSLWSNSYAILVDGWNGARFQTTSTSLVRNNQLPICFHAVLLSIRSLTMWEGYESGRCTFILNSDFVCEGMDSNKHARKYRKLFVSHHRCILHLKLIAPFHQSSRRL